MPATTSNRVSVFFLPTLSLFSLILFSRSKEKERKTHSVQKKKAFQGRGNEKRTLDKSRTKKKEKRGKHFIIFSFPSLPLSLFLKRTFSLADHVRQVGDVADDVVREGARQVPEQALDRPLARHEGLDREPDKRDHRKPPVLDLLHCVGLRVEPGRVEREDRVLLARLPGLEARGLEEAEDDLLDGDKAEDGDSFFFFFFFSEFFFEQSRSRSRLSLFF